MQISILQSSNAISAAPSSANAGDIHPFSSCIPSTIFTEFPMPGEAFAITVPSISTEIKASAILPPKSESLFAEIVAIFFKSSKFSALLFISSSFSKMAFFAASTPLLRDKGE